MPQNRPGGFRVGEACAASTGIGGRREEAKGGRGASGGLRGQGSAAAVGSGKTEVWRGSQDAQLKNN